MGITWLVVLQSCGYRYEEWMGLKCQHLICPMFKQLARRHITGARLWWPDEIEQMKVWVHLGGGRGRRRIAGFVHGITDYWLWLRKHEAASVCLTPTQGWVTMWPSSGSSYCRFSFPYSRWFHTAGAFLFCFGWDRYSHANLSNILTGIPNEIVRKGLFTHKTK